MRPERPRILSKEEQERSQARFREEYRLRVEAANLTLSRITGLREALEDLTNCSVREAPGTFDTVVQALASSPDIRKAAGIYIYSTSTGKDDPEAADGLNRRLSDALLEEYEKRLAEK
jgi:hypothetical protein